VTKFLKPSVAGFLLQKELDYLDGAVANPKRPFVAIVGGSKVSSKIGVIESLISKVDKIILGCGPAERCGLRPRAPGRAGAARPAVGGRPAGTRCPVEPAMPRRVHARAGRCACVLPRCAAACAPRPPAASRRPAARSDPRPNPDPNPYHAARASGGMIFTFYKARGLAVGSSLVEEDKLELAKERESMAKSTVGAAPYPNPALSPPSPLLMGALGRRPGPGGRRTIPAERTRMCR